MFTSTAFIVRREVAQFIEMIKSCYCEMWSHFKLTSLQLKAAINS